MMAIFRYLKSYKTEGRTDFFNLTLLIQRTELEHRIPRQANFGLYK